MTEIQAVSISPTTPVPHPLLTPTTIEGLYTVNLRIYSDERGRFMETFRREWFPQVNWDRMQNNRSDSRTGVLRGLHYHFHQVDYWYVAKGIIRAAMIDLRPNSPSFRAVHTMEMGVDGDERLNVGAFIPVGVAHGFYARTDCTLMYIVNNYYDASDECGVAWDDPTLGIDWGLTGAPLLSQRDQLNRRLGDIPADELPR